MFSQRATMLVFIWAIFATFSLVFMLGYEFHAHNTINHDEIVPRVRKAGESSLVPRRSGAIARRRDDDDDNAVVHNAKAAAGLAVQQNNKPKAGQAPVRVCRNGKPVSKLIYIKTHKTGSSTLSNIFHRYGVQHNLRMALPKDNLFYAWPHGQASNIINSVDTSKLSIPPFDILASAHVRYVPEALESMVPGGKYVTILRNPQTHFVSSWVHWHVWEHIEQQGGPKLSPLQFLKGFELYEQHLRMTDRVLVMNSFAFDLGIDEPTQDNMIALIQEMETKFPVVMITEHMLESLVLLKRALCWKLEDIVYLSLKVTSHRAKEVAKEPEHVAEERSALISKLNWADTMLYKHFNRTLFEKIALEEDFYEEVAEVQAQVKWWSLKCKDFDKWDEDAHRVQLEEKQISDELRLCHYMWLDSKGFVKHLKRKAGHPIEKLECWATFPARKVVNLVMDSPADDVVINMLAQWSIVSGADMVVTDDEAQTQKREQGLLYDGNPTVFRSSNAFLYALPGYKYDRPYLDSFSPGLIFITTFRHPVQEFLDAWVKLGMRARIRIAAKDDTLDLVDFLQKPNEHLKAVSTPSFDARYHLLDRTARRFGLPYPKHTASDDAYMMKHLWWFALILIAEHPDESIVMMRRTLCWGITNVALHDMARWKQSVQYKLSDFSTASMSVRELEAAILKLNPMDDKIYRRANETLWGKIERQVAFDEELGQFRQQRKDFNEFCQKNQHVDDSKLDKDDLARKERCFVNTRGERVNNSIMVKSCTVKSSRKLALQLGRVGQPSKQH
eukprot:m.155047 g.155047  ORF g.155047 m.155047 type:complete len:786 (-) comp16403_c0_seq15:402-2759(-)